MRELAPDLGLPWWRAGHAGKQILLRRIPVDSIGRVSADVFTTTVNLSMEVVFALSIDLGPEALEELLGLVPPGTAAGLRTDLRAPFRQPMFVELPRTLVDFTAHLGAPQQCEEEHFVPLVVDAVRPASRIMSIEIVEP